MEASITLDKMAYNILNLIRGGRSSNNEHVPIEQIKFNILYYRSLLIRRSLQRDQNFRVFEQDLGFVDIDIHEESQGVGMNLSTYIARTREQLPNFLRAKGGPAVTFVGPEDKRTRYPLIESFEHPYQAYNKYTAGKHRSYLLNDYLYIINDSGAEAVNKMIEDGTEFDEDDFITAHSYINIRGIFEDPRQVADFKNESEVDVAMSMDLVQEITQSIGNGEVAMMKETKDDRITDNVQQ